MRKGRIEGRRERKLFQRKRDFIAGSFPKCP